MIVDLVVVFWGVAVSDLWFFGVVWWFMVPEVALLVDCGMLV